MLKKTRLLIATKYLFEENTYTFKEHPFAKGAPKFLNDEKEHY